MARYCKNCGQKVSEYTSASMRYYEKNKERLNKERTERRKIKKQGETK